MNQGLKSGVRWLLLGFFLAISTVLPAQDDDGIDDDIPNRLFVEKDWVKYSPTQVSPEKVEKLFFEEEDEFNPEVLKKFTNLKGLIIKDTEVNDLRFMRFLPMVRVLELQGNHLTTLDGLEGSIQMEELAITNNFLKVIPQLKYLVNLRRLRLYDNDITDISPIANLKYLTALDLAKNQIRTIAPLRDFTQLRLLSVYQCTLLTDISIIRNFTNLNDLNISLLNIPNFSLSTLGGMTKMENLRIQGMVRSNAELEYIKYFTEIEQLTMGLNDGVTQIDSLWRFTQLKYLDIHSDNVTSIAVLRNFHEMIKVVMYTNKVEDLSPLQGCPGLKALFIYNNPIKDYTLLYQFRDLQYLHLSLKDFDLLQQQQMRHRLPTTKILFY